MSNSFKKFLALCLAVTLVVGLSPARSGLMNIRAENSEIADDIGEGEGGTDELLEDENGPLEDEVVPSLSPETSSAPRAKNRPVKEPPAAEPRTTPAPTLGNDSATGDDSVTEWTLTPLNDAYTPATPIGDAGNTVTEKKERKAAGNGKELPVWDYEPNPRWTPPPSEAAVTETQTETQSEYEQEYEQETVLETEPETVPEYVEDGNTVETVAVIGNGFIGPARSAGVMNSGLNVTDSSSTEDKTNDDGEKVPTVPGAPANLNATPGPLSITVSFDAPEDNGGADITLYTVTATPENGEYAPLTWTGSAPGTVVFESNVYVVNYTVSVTATNTAGTGLAATTTVTPEGEAAGGGEDAEDSVNAPGVPTNLNVTAGKLSITARFGAPDENGGSPITKYTVTATPDADPDSPWLKTLTKTLNQPGEVTFDEPMTVYGVNYTVSVTATNEAGNTGLAAIVANVKPATLDSGDINPMAGTYAITLSSIGTHTFTAWDYNSGYDLSSAPLTVTITNQDSGDTIANLAVSLDGGNSGNFTVTQPTLTTLNAGTMSTDFTVYPNSALAAGTYTTTVKVVGDGSGTGNVTASFTVSFTVNALAITGGAITGLTDPVAGQSPVTTAINLPTNCTSVTAITWSPGDDPFKKGGVYTATFTLTAAANYKFDNTTYTYAGATVTTTSQGTGETAEVKVAFSPLATTAPDAPTIGTATDVTPSTATTGSVEVSFSTPADDGGSAITQYTVTSDPDSITATGSASPITVTGLTLGTSYTFTVTATNPSGTSGSSGASNSVTPTISVTGLTVSPAQVNFVVGNDNTTGRRAITATITPSGATNKDITWDLTGTDAAKYELYTTASSGTALTLPYTGSASTVYVAVKSGETIAEADDASVVATSNDNAALIRTVLINVTASFVPVTGISGVPTAATAGTPLTLTSTVTPMDATDSTITWSVKDAGTTGATIAGNILSTTASGTVVVTATIASGLATGSYTQDFTITVTGTAYTVTYDGNGHNVNSPPAAQTATYGNTITVSGQGTMARTGYTFAGWNTASGGSGTAYAAGASLTVTGNITLYAQWTARSGFPYGVYYDGNGATSGSVAHQTAALTASTSTVTLASGSGFTRTGYTFSHWSTAANGSGTLYAGGASVRFTNVTGDIILYAQWTSTTSSSSSWWSRSRSRTQTYYPGVYVPYYGTAADGATPSITSAIVNDNAAGRGATTLQVPAGRDYVDIGYDSVQKLVELGMGLNVKSALGNFAFGIPASALKNLNMSSGGVLRVIIRPVSSSVQGALAGTCHEVLLYVNGQQITSFNYPVEMAFNMKNTAQANSQSLCGIRDNGGGKFDRLGGRMVGGDLVVNTTSLSRYAVIVAENMVRLNMRLGDANYTLNSRKLSFDSPPTVVADRVMVPLRFITEAFGATVTWNDSTKTATVSLEGKVTSVTIGRTNTGMDVAPVIINNRTLVPLRYIAESFGANVVWDDETREIDIYR